MSRMTSTERLRVAIVGGGIGGLSAANALRRRGLEVTVFEQAKVLGEVGAGVFIYPNSLRQLERMGFRDALAGVGARVGRGSEYCRMDGTVERLGATARFEVSAGDELTILTPGGGGFGSP